MTRLTSNCRLTKYTWNEHAPIKRNAWMTDHHLTRENVDSAANRERDVTLCISIASVVKISALCNFTHYFYEHVHELRGILVHL